MLSTFNVGLSPLIIGTDKHAMSYHSALVKDVSFLAFGDKTLLESTSNWNGDHLLFGMTRLIDRLMKDNAALFPAGFASEFNLKTVRLRAKAYDYMHAAPAV